MAHADMAERIHHAFARENAVCSDEIFDQVVQLDHRFPHPFSLTYMFVQNGGNSVASSLRSSHRPSLLNFSCGTLKHIVSFARSQAMAENPVLLFSFASPPPGNVNCFVLVGEPVPVYDHGGGFYASE